MKPTNSPTQGQPNPRKNRLKVAFGPLFPTAKYYFVGWDWFQIGNTEQTTRNPTQSNSPQTPLCIRVTFGLEAQKRDPYVPVRGSMCGTHEMQHTPPGRRISKLIFSTTGNRYMEHQQTQSNASVYRKIWTSSLRRHHPSLLLGVLSLSVPPLQFYYHSTTFSSSFPVVIQARLQGLYILPGTYQVAGTPPPPPPLRSTPSLSRDRVRIFFPHQLASNCAHTSYRKRLLLSSSMFTQDLLPREGSNPRNRPSVVVTAVVSIVSRILLSYRAHT